MKYVFGKVPFIVAFSYAIFKTVPLLNSVELQVQLILRGQNKFIHQLRYMIFSAN